MFKVQMWRDKIIQIQVTYRSVQLSNSTANQSIFPDLPGPDETDPMLQTSKSKAAAAVHLICKQCCNTLGCRQMINELKPTQATDILFSRIRALQLPLTALLQINVS